MAVILVTFLSNSFLIVPTGHGQQTHWAKILPWFGSGPNWSPFPALPQPLCGFLCPWMPTALSDLQAALWTSYAPRSNGLPFPPNDSWPTCIEALSSRRLPKRLDMLQKRAEVIWKLLWCWDKISKIAKWGLPSQGNGRLAQIYIPPTYLGTDWLTLCGSFFLFPSATESCMPSLGGRLISRIFAACYIILISLFKGVWCTFLASH